jgi:hypothetical protein
MIRAPKMRVWAVLGILAAAAPAMAQQAPATTQPGPAQRAPAPPPPAPGQPGQIPNHRQIMRDIVEVMARYAKQRDPKFVLLAHGATGLIIKEPREDQLERANDPDDRQADTKLPLGGIYRNYVRLFDGLVVNELYCDRADALIAQNAAAQNQPKPPPPQQKTDAGTPYTPKPRVTDPTPFEQKSVQQIVKELLGEDAPKPAPVAPTFPGLKTPQMVAAELAAQQRAARQRQFHDAVAAMRAEGRKVLSVDPCEGAAGKAISAAAKDKALTYPYADTRLRLDSVPAARPPNENAKPVLNLADARNFLMNLSSVRFGSRAEWIAALDATNYDVLILDVFHRSDALTRDEVRALKFKKVGAPRLVLAAMQVGRAFDSRFYWKPEWRPGAPPFLAVRDETNPGAFIVEYWDPAWKEIMGKTIAGIMDLGFDGVVFTDIDTYRTFEERTPLEP